MGEHKRRASLKMFDPETTPANAISIKVDRQSLRSVVDNGLKKSNWFERHCPISIGRRVYVEGAEHGTDDSVFFVPEHASVDHSHQRTLPAQYIKVNPADHQDIVHRGDDFEISFVGMSVAPMDFVGNNDILLCSLTRKKNSSLEQRLNAKTSPVSSDPGTSSSADTEDMKQLKNHALASQTMAMAPGAAASSAATRGQHAAAGKATDKSTAKDVDKGANTAPDISADTSDATEIDPVKAEEPSAELRKKKEMQTLTELPTALTVQPQDILFLHYDPEVDGHDTGSSADSFVPIPGSKRVYLQRYGEKGEKCDVSIRFTVMEIDKLSEEQLIAIKGLDEIGKSVGKAAATVPYLKIISWMLKFANFLGRSALKKVAEPEHVLSKDMVFLLADAVAGNTNNAEDGIARTSSCTTRREQYGNYLRYGYYFFLNTTVDAKLYAQTGASSQNVPLLLRRTGYNSKFALKNEREFFPMSGVSYAVVKVTQGCSEIDPEQRIQMQARHRTRLVKLLKKYTGKLENAVD